MSAVLRALERVSAGIVAWRLLRSAASPPSNVVRFRAAPAPVRAARLSRGPLLRLWRALRLLAEALGWLFALGLLLAYLRA